MDKEKMKVVAQQMNRVSKNWDTKAGECAALVSEGMLTADEAAQCLLGADLKEREAIREDGFRPGPGHSLSVARQAIDSRLPGYNGLVAGRHI